MLKINWLYIFLCFSAVNVTAQNSQVESPKELLLALQKSKSDTNRISFQLQLGNYYLCKPVRKAGESKRNIDSSVNLLKQAYQLSVRLQEPDWQYKVLRTIGYSYACAGDMESCKLCYKRVIAYYHQQGNIGKEADAWESLATWYHYSESDFLKETISNYQHAYSLFLQNHQQVEAADVLCDMADVQIVHKQLDVAEKELQRSLALYRANGYNKLYSVYRTLNQLEYNRGNFYRAMAYCMDAIKNVRAEGDTGNIAYLYGESAKCYYAVKKYNECLQWIKKAVVVRQYDTQYRFIMVQTLIALNRTKEAQAVLNNITSEKILRNCPDTLYFFRDFALYYRKLNNNVQAVRYYLNFFKIFNELDKKNYLPEEERDRLGVMSNNEAASIYLEINQPAKAKKYIDHTALLFKNVKTTLDPQYLVDFYDNSYKYNVATGNYKVAAENLERRVKLQDTLFTADKDKQLAELNIQYQTAQQEQSIKDLHSQGAAQKTSLEKADLQRNVTIGGILVMILISALFYRNYKQKQKANNTITNKNEQLQHLLTEKEWLLKEVHHRVKNNLHTVICLLESQSHYLENDALKAIENSQHRIYAMSLIHQKLYQSDDIKTIDMASYIPELAESLKEGFGTSGQILFKLNIDKINLPISHAIPLGLMINEAVTNSIKYAFPGNGKGEISISMLHAGDRIVLELADNGIGMLQIDTDDEPESLGLRLMKGLSEDIDAEISFKVDNGTQIKVIFKQDALDDPENTLIPFETKEEYI